MSGYPLSVLRYIITHMKLMPNRKKITFTLMSLPFLLMLPGCASSGDPMPATKVDVFVLDLSTSNDAIAQFQRIQEDIMNSLTEKSFGVPKMTPEGEPVSGPVTTIFSFIVDAAPKAETF